MRVRHGDAAGARNLLESRPDTFWIPGDKRRLERLLGPPVAEHRPPGIRLNPAGESAPLPTPTGPPASAFAPRLGWLGLPPPPRPAPPAPAPVQLALGQTRHVSLSEAAVSLVVVDEEVADVHLTAPDTLYVVARNPGQTEIAIDLEGGERVHTKLTVVQDPSPVQAVLDTLDEGKHLTAVGLPRAISIRGTVPTPESAQWVLKRVAGAVPEDAALDDGMRIEGPLQVELEVQIAEIQRSVSERLGISWETLANRGVEDVNIVSGAFTTFPTGLDPEAAIRVGSRATIGGLKLTVLIEALASAGLANVLARPTLTALSGEEASFQAGGRIPVLKGEKDGRRDYAYEPLGVILGFVPTVLSEDRIGISVRAEVQEEDESRVTEVGLPILSARMARTVVEVGNGESFIIAGLFSTSSEQSESGVPVLKGVPGLGLLFGQTRFEAEERELIIMVTARLVAPGEVPEEGEEPPRGRMVHGYHV